MTKHNFSDVRLSDFISSYLNEGESVDGFKILEELRKEGKLSIGLTQYGDEWVVTAIDVDDKDIIEKINKAPRIEHNYYMVSQDVKGEYVIGEEPEYSDIVNGTVPVVGFDNGDFAMFIGIYAESTYCDNCGFDENRWEIVVNPVTKCISANYSFGCYGGGEMSFDKGGERTLQEVFDWIAENCGKDNPAIPSCLEDLREFESPFDIYPPVPEMGYFLERVGGVEKFNVIPQADMMPSNFTEISVEHWFYGDHFAQEDIESILKN